MFPGDSVVCTATGLAVISGLHTNIATLVGSPGQVQNCPGCLPDDYSTWPTDPGSYLPASDDNGVELGQATDSDPSHYYAAVGDIEIEKATNGEDADTPTGPFVETGAAVTWTFEVTNTGSAPLASVTVSDDQGVAVTCPPSAFDAGGDNVIDLLAVLETVTCTATGTAASYQYANIGSVTGTAVAPPVPDSSYDPMDSATYPPVGDFAPIAGTPAVTDDDPSHYFGVNPAIDIEKATNAVDADTAPGVGVELGSQVTWTLSLIHI